MLTLHLYHLSPFNQKIRRMLNLKGIAYAEKYWGLTQRKQVQAFNPTGKLPAMEHNGHWVCDSTDIAWYIEQQFPEPPLIPTDPHRRGLMHAIEDWADESLYFYEMHLRFTTPGNAERNLPRMLERESALVRWLLLKVLRRGITKITRNQGIGRKNPGQLITDVQRHVRAVADMLESGEWLLGDTISLADLAVYAMFDCFRDADMAAAVINQHPAVVDWMQRVEATSSTRVAP